MAEEKTTSANSQVATPENKSAKSDNFIRSMAARVTFKEEGEVKKEEIKDVKAIPNGESSETSSVKSEEKKESTTIENKSKVEEKKEPSESKPTPKANTLEYWKEESAKHQSRADKAESENKKFLTEKEAEIASLKAEVEKYKPLVERFEANPMEVIQNYLPQIQEQLSLQNGNQLGFIEQQVANVKAQLDSEFTKQFGKNWRYSDYESLTPGTPSFKYKLALDTARENARTKFSGYVAQQKKAVEQQQLQIQEDKKKLVQEYGFTDEDFKAVEEFSEKNNLSYYFVAKIALFDKLLQQAVEKAGVLSPKKAPQEIHREPSASGDIKHNTQLSSGGKKILGTLGIPRN